MLIGIGWFAWSVVNAMIAGANRRNSAGVFFASIFFSPLLVFLYLLAVGKNDIVQPVASLPIEPVKSPAPKKISQPGSGASTLNKVAILIVGSLILIVIIVLAQSLITAQRNKVAFVSIPAFPTLPKVIEKGRSGWVSGVETCKTSKEYGQLVASTVGFYMSPEVSPSSRFAVIPHGSKIEVFNFANGMQRIRYNDKIGYVQDLFVVNYDPATGVRPSTVGC